MIEQTKEAAICDDGSVIISSLHSYTLQITRFSIKIHFHLTNCVRTEKKIT